MKTYQTLLFDVDDTLLDFGAAENQALALLFKEQGIPFTKEIEETYQTINKGLWEDFEQGKLERDELVNTRFYLLFKEFDREVDGVKMEQSYRRFLEEGHELVDGAFDLILNLKENYELYIVTNGVSKTQDKRLRDSGLHPLFKDIFVSEDTGYQKPMREYFDYVFERIPNFNLEKTLIIGDTLGSDILGGANVGMDTCWFNPSLKENTTDITPTYELKTLDGLYGILD
ncbi:YjjG family noncanonical pyrimidine nucleotidase [Carnobacterium gallinarum]|uniref:YjjG family noncanonical pyrimidine nucleotidase n=1 Tax=Carnobacterium gallinarum TaxID=2749 RepID=UPI00055515B2|nr:YjjG family noncanonical pyrimidine nucleotidase [Carnobacterium gallinarum]